MSKKSWTLFLDRDGVINSSKLVGNIQNRAEFQFLSKNLSFFKKFSEIFGTIIVVTNQQGIAKGLITVEDLHDIHSYMISEIEKAGGHVNKVYFCPEHAYLKSQCRKPNSGMALEAQTDFPDIDFAKSVMVGDSDTDIEFGKRLGMTTVWIDNGVVSDKKRAKIKSEADFLFNSLEGFAETLTLKGIEFFSKTDIV